MKFEWKQQQITRMPAQVVGEELVRLEKKHRGKLLPKTIVNESRNKKAKLHECFEWNDKQAADEYRVNQARELLRKIVVVYKDSGGKKNTIRTFVRIKDEDRKQSYYTTTARIIDEPELQENVLNQILSDLIAIKKKYGQFKTPKLQKIWDAIEDALVAA